MIIFSSKISISSNFSVASTHKMLLVIFKNLLTKIWYHNNLTSHKWINQFIYFFHEEEIVLSNHSVYKGYVGICIRHHQWSNKFKTHKYPGRPEFIAFSIMQWNSSDSRSQFWNRSNASSVTVNGNLNYSFHTGIHWSATDSGSLHLFIRMEWKTESEFSINGSKTY